MFNKVKNLVLIASLFSVYQLSAQDAFSLGPRAGVNFSNVSHVTGSKSLLGPVFGLTSTYSINESTGLSLDILYSGEGYKVGSNEAKIAFIQVPLYFDLFFGKLGEKFHPKVYAGVAPEFLLNAKYNGVKVDKSGYSSVNFAVSGGLGFNYKVANRIWLNTDLRAFLGLNDVRAKAFRIGDKITDNTIQFSLGLAYGLSKL
ncbi:MAG: outer membrane beta-barrel protein [Saprospiraceae bacterium]